MTIHTTHRPNGLTAADGAQAVWRHPSGLDAAGERAAVRATLDGDVNAFRGLVEAHQGQVYGLAARMLGNPGDAEDAAQDAFTQAYTRLAGYNQDWRFKTWLMAITTHLCIDRLRRRKHEPLAFADYAYNTAPGQPEDADPVEASFVSPEPQPDAVTMRRQQDAAIQAMLAELAPEDRAMLVMFYWHDMPYDEIAVVTGATLSAVKSRLFRARQKLAGSALAGRL